MSEADQNKYFGTGTADSIRADGGKLVFAGIHGNIRDMFDVAGFLDVFPVVDQIEPDIA